VLSSTRHRWLPSFASVLGLTYATLKASLDIALQCGVVDPGHRWGCHPCAWLVLCTSAAGCCLADSKSCVQVCRVGPGYQTRHSLCMCTAG
jgi:hypothetical protein